MKKTSISTASSADTEQYDDRDWEGASIEHKGKVIGTAHKIDQSARKLAQLGDSEPQLDCVPRRRSELASG